MKKLPNTTHYNQLSEDNKKHFKNLVKLIENNENEEFKKSLEESAKKEHGFLNIKDKNGKTLLHFAVHYENTEAIDFFLTTGANGNIQDKNGKTPLHIAAKYGYTDIIKALIENGANGNIQDNNGKTPLHVAVEYGYTNTIKELLPNCDLNIQDNNGHNAFAQFLNSTSYGVVSNFECNNTPPLLPITNKTKNIYPIDYDSYKSVSSESDSEPLELLGNSD